jgi:regulator of cell morphogenesis and NO signaling
MGAGLVERTVGELVVERPARAAVLERLGIDYCCGGRLSLKAACERRGLEPDAVLRELELCDDSEAEERTDWSAESLGALIDHIQDTHHQYLREELPRLAHLTAKVVRAHGERHPELAALQRVFASLRIELEAHMAKEEQVLFPICRELEGSRTLPALHCGSVDNPIRVMVQEHEDAGRALETMRELTGGFTPPLDACNTYRVLLDGLVGLERDMHRHVHEENNILFPRAAAIEAALPYPVG